MISVANPHPAAATTTLSAPCPTCNVRAVGRRPKSKVLVVLPPTYRSANLDRLLLLARDAYDNEELDIMDMNIQFAWIGPEMIAGVQPGAAAAVAAAPAAVSVASAPAPALVAAASAAPVAAKVPAAAVDSNKPSKTATSAASAPSARLPELQGVAATGVPFEEQWKRNSQAQAAAATPAPAATGSTESTPKPAQPEPKKPVQKPEPKPAAAAPATPAAPVKSTPTAAPAGQKKPAQANTKTTAAPAPAPAAAKPASKPAPAAQPKPAPVAAPAKPASPAPAAVPAPKPTPSVSTTTSSKPSTPDPPKPASAPAGPTGAGLADWIKQGLRTLASSPTPSATSSTGAATANDDGDTPAGPITEHRVRVTNFMPTVQDYQMIMLLPSGIKLHKVEFHPAEHNGPNFKLVRSATFTFATAHEAETMAKWIKDKNAGGQLGKLLLPKTKVSVVVDTVEPLEEIDEDLEVRTATSIKKPAAAKASAAPAKVEYDIPMEEIDEDMDPTPPAPRSAASSRRESPVFAAKSGNDYSPPSPAKQSVPGAAASSGSGFSFSLPAETPVAKSPSPTGKRFTVKLHGIDGFTPAPLVHEFVLEHSSVTPKSYETEAASPAALGKSASPFQTSNDKSVVFVFDNQSDADKLTAVLHQGLKEGRYHHFCAEGAEIRVEACDGKSKSRADLTGGVTSRQVGGQTVVDKVVGGSKITMGGVFADQALAGAGMSGSSAASEASGNGKAGGKAKKGKAGSGGGKWRSKYDDMD